MRSQAPALRLPGAHADRRRRGRLALPALVVAGMTVVAGAIPADLHDAVGAFAPAPRLPVVVVVAEDPDAAVLAARGAGAAAVWSSLPAAGASADPGRLEADARGRIRWSAGRALPLPEALHGLREVDAAGLGGAVRLDGREAVVVSADPAIGLREVVPGHGRPVDRGRILAIERGAELADRWLRRLPLPVAAGGVLGLALAAGHRAWRRMPRRALAEAAVLSLLSFALAVAARCAGVDLPVGGLVAAPLVPAIARAVLATADGLRLLDRLALWVGDAGGVVADPDLDARARLLAAWLPDAHVRAVAGAVPVAAEDEIVEPVRSRGEVIGALVVRSRAPRPQTAAFVRTLVSAWPYAEPAGVAEPEDPFEVRVALAREAVSRALARARRWEGLLGHTEGKIGLFDAAGQLVAASGELQEMARGAGPALLQVLAAFDVEDAAAVARGVVATGVAATVGTPGGELRLHPVLDGSACAGVLLVVSERRVAAVNLARTARRAG